VKIILTQLTNTSYRVTDFANEMSTSTRQLERTLKKYTGLTPTEFIKEIRLQKAYSLLEKQKYATVSEVRYEIGIESASYFTKKFTERFGKNPKNFLET